jgi:hypothetical protein
LLDWRSWRMALLHRRWLLDSRNRSRLRARLRLWLWLWLLLR